MNYQILIKSWLVVEPPTPLKNDGRIVSWDDDSQPEWKNKIHVPNHQSAINEL